MAKTLNQPCASWQPQACSKNVCIRRMLQVAAVRTAGSTTPDTAEATQDVQRQAVLQQWKEHKQRRRRDGTPAPPPQQQRQQQPKQQAKQQTAGAPDGMADAASIQAQPYSSINPQRAETASKVDQPQKPSRQGRQQQQQQRQQAVPSARIDACPAAIPPQTSTTEATEAAAVQPSRGGHTGAVNTARVEAAKQLAVSPAALSAATQSAASMALGGNRVEALRARKVNSQTGKRHKWQRQPAADAGDGLQELLQGAAFATLPPPDTVRQAQDAAAEDLQQHLPLAPQQQQQPQGRPKSRQQQAGASPVENQANRSAVMSKAAKQGEGGAGKQKHNQRPAAQQHPQVPAQHEVKTAAKRVSTQKPGQNNTKQRPTSGNTGSQVQQTLRRLNLMRHHHSVWGLAARIAHRRTLAHKPGIRKRKTFGRGRLARLTGSIGSNALDLDESDEEEDNSFKLSAEHVLLLRLSKYRPVALDDTVLQVSQVVPYGQQDWDTALSEATSQQLLTGFSLQQLSFTTAALAACQHPCPPSFVQHLYASIAPKLRASMQQLKAEWDNTNTPGTHALVTTATASKTARSNSSRLGAATKNMQQNAQIGKAPSLAHSADSTVEGARLPKGTSLTLYPAACLAVGLLRLQVAVGQQADMISPLPESSLSSSTTVKGVQDEAIRVAEGAQGEVLHVAKSMQQLMKLLLQWCQLSLRLHHISPWNDRHNARWFANMAWALSALPSRLEYYHLQANEPSDGWHTPSGVQVHTHSQAPRLPASVMGTTRADAHSLKLYALPSSISHSISRCVLMRRGWMQRLLDPLSAMRLAAVLGCTTPYNPTTQPATLSRQQPLQSVPGNFLTQGTTVGEHVTARAGHQEDFGPGLQATQRTETRTDKSQTVLSLTSPTQQLAVRQLLRRVFLQVGQLPPSGMAALVGLLATASAPVVEEAYTPAVVGSRQRRSVSLMQRLSKLVRARVHVIKPRELLMLLTGLVLLHRRHLALPASAIPDALMLDELTRWAANKLQNASPSQAAQLLLTMAAIRWYNSFWWDKAGHYLLRIGTGKGGFSLQQIQQVLAAFAAVHHPFGPLLSHFRKQLLRVLPEQAATGNTTRTGGGVATQHQATVAPAAALSMLTSFVALGYIHAQLFDRLVAASIDTAQQPTAGRKSSPQQHLEQAVGAAQQQQQQQQGQAADTQQYQAAGAAQQVRDTGSVQQGATGQAGKAPPQPSSNLPDSNPQAAAAALAPASVWAALAAGCACLGHVPETLQTLVLQYALQTSRPADHHASSSSPAPAILQQAAGLQISNSGLGRSKAGARQHGAVQEGLPADLHQQLRTLSDAAYCLILSQHPQGMLLASNLCVYLNTLTARQLSGVSWGPSMAAVLLAYVADTVSSIPTGGVWGPTLTHPSQKVLRACITSGAVQAYWTSKTRPGMPADVPLPSVKRQQLLSHLKEALQMMGARQVVVGHLSHVVTPDSQAHVASTGSHKAGMTIGAASVGAGSPKGYQAPAVLNEVAAVMVPDVSCLMRLQPKMLSVAAASTGTQAVQETTAGDRVAVKHTEPQTQQMTVHVLLHAGLGLPSGSCTLEHGSGTYNDVLFRLRLMQYACGLPKSAVLVPLSVDAMRACTQAQDRVALLQKSLSRVGWQVA